VLSTHLKKYASQIGNPTQIVVKTYIFDTTKQFHVYQKSNEQPVSPVIHFHGNPGGNNGFMN